MAGAEPISLFFKKRPTTSNHYENDETENRNVARMRGTGTNEENSTL